MKQFLRTVFDPTTKLLIKIFVGWVVILIFLSILLTSTFAIDPTVGFGEALGYGIVSAVSLFILSTFCTGGVGIIVWMPLGYGVGWVAFKLAGWDEAAKDGQQREPHSKVSLTREQQALVNYIRKARAGGMNDERISQVLTNEDWPTDTIAAAFQMARNG